jgi:alkylation response protein AidB-like acyl-CoA dehydrogenase
VYQLTEEQLLLRDTVRQLARQHIEPRAMEIDAAGQFPWDIKDLLARHQVIGLPFPVEYGGLGASVLTTCLALEEIARVCASSCLIPAVQALGSFPLISSANAEQKQRFLPALASGERLAAFALTEPEAGSDAAAMTTTARKDGDGYILNGRKHYITNAGIADVYSVFAMTDRSRGTRGLSCLAVEKGMPGFSFGRMENKMGIRGSQTGELIFEDCRVPMSNLIGREGEGFRIAMLTLDKSRPAVGAQAVGIAQGAVDYAAQYAKKRIQFGQPIAQFQGIQFMLADMETHVAAARELVYRAATMVDNMDRQMGKYAAMAKLFASDVAMRVTTDAVQILGGAGYMKDLPVERMMRDAKITQIYEGTNQIQRLVVARHVLK